LTSSRPNGSIGDITNQVDEIPGPGIRRSTLDAVDGVLSAVDFQREPDLTGADLSRAHLSDAYLSRAHLSGADLRVADLSHFAVRSVAA